MLYLHSVLIASDTSKASINLGYTYKIGIAVFIMLMSFSKKEMKAWKENNRHIWK
jgi:hypothetical protein